MKKISLCLITVLIFLTFCGCENNSKSVEDNDNTNINVVINEPCDNSVNGYRVSTPTTNSNQTTGTLVSDGNYYANKNSKKFHKSTCGSASTIKESNLYITSNRDELISAGYSPCSRCNP